MDTYSDATAWRCRTPFTSYERDEFERLRSKGDLFIERVFEGARVALIGGEDEPDHGL